jgi:hypothetical protein
MSSAVSISARSGWSAATLEEVVDPARVQLCGTFVAELSGRRVGSMPPGRQGRLMFGYLVAHTRFPATA